VTNIKEARNMKGESIIKPKAIKDFRKKRIILIPFEPFKSIIKSLFKNKIQKKSSLFLSEIYLTHDKVILFKALSAPLAVMCLETLIVSGAKEIIILGFCGSFNKNIPIGSAVIINEAYSEEGTSKHYFPKNKNFKASSKLITEIKNNLELAGFQYSLANCVSTDAPFRETYQWINKMRKKGIDCVDMEASAVYALAKYYKIEAGALMIVSDIIINDKWLYNFSAIKDKIKKYFSIFI
jgi:uridine phosphorylase